jgi:prepilin-type N-terminal cleavage/methylation domain-containing protein
MFRNRGFSLIELMIVVAIIGILVAVALPQFTSMTEDSKKSKVKQDLDVYVNAIIRFKASEARQLKGIEDLLGKYVANEMKDPWGNEYKIDLENGCCFSMGADGREGTADDIVHSYLPPMMPIQARLVDCGDRANAGRIGLGDKLEVIFTRTINPESITDFVGDYVDGDASSGYFTFGFYDAEGEYVRYEIDTAAVDPDNGDELSYEDPNTPGKFKLHQPIGIADADYVIPSTNSSKNRSVKSWTGKDEAGEDTFDEISDQTCPFAYVSPNAKNTLVIYLGKNPGIKPGLMYINTPNISADSDENTLPTFKDYANRTDPEECAYCRHSATALKLQL